MASAHNKPPIWGYTNDYDLMHDVLDEYIDTPRPLPPTITTVPMQYMTDTAFIPPDPTSAIVMLTGLPQNEFTPRPEKAITLSPW